MSDAPRALIADDEPLLRDELARQLAIAWPELEIAAQARNGRDALQRFETLRPDVCFLDVRMPGLSGVEVARRIQRRAHVVFVTAYDDYAVQAFDTGAVDYLVKPVMPERLADTVSRLRQRVRRAPAAIPDQLLNALAERLQPRDAPAPLRWLRAAVANTVKLIPVEDIEYLRSEDKYTRVAWRENGRAADALIRTPLKELVERLDPAQFLQVHRGAAVNLRAIAQVVRLDNETARIHLRDRPEVLPVSRGYLHHFRQM